MSYSDSFPSVSPTYQIDFANGGRIPPNATFSRPDSPINGSNAPASAVHYWSNEKHESSQNLITNSEDFSAWTASNTTPTANAIAAPDGATTADTITGNSGTSSKYVLSNSISAAPYPVISVYVKAGTHNYIQIHNDQSSTHYANFDVTSGAGVVGSVGSNTTSTIQAVGSTGWYRCICRINTASMTSGIKVRLVDSASAAYGASSSTTGTVHLWGAMATDIGDLTNIVAYQSSTGQIHREYAPTLKSVATAGQPRFEYDPTDGQSAGTSLGCLIESQATNLNPYSDALASWGSSGDVVIESDSAIGPDGTLTADLVIANTTNTAHYVRSGSISVSSSSSYTLSGYFKAVNGYRVRLVAFRTAAPYTGEIGAVFTLSGSGSVTTTAGTATIESVGNGWYRCVGTGTAGTSASHIQVQIIKSDGSDGYAGDGYSGVICSKIQYELGSFASSPISTSGSTVTRAADSMSVTDSSLFDNGSGALAAEYDMFAASETSYLLHIEKSSGGTNGGGISVTNRYLGVESNYLDLGNTTSNVFHKVAASWETGSQKMSRDGGAASEDTSTVIPSGTDKLFIGVRQDGGEHVNGHIKRLAIYSEPLSSTNLQALTS